MRLTFESSRSGHVLSRIIVLPECARARRGTRLHATTEKDRLAPGISRLPAIDPVRVRRLLERRAVLRQLARCRGPGGNRPGGRCEKDEPDPRRTPYCCGCHGPPRYAGAGNLPRRRRRGGRETPALKVERFTAGAPPRCRSSSTTGRPAGTIPDSRRPRSLAPP